jgi:SEC-C motif-containing protein
MKPAPTPCPCHSGRHYVRCCQPFHQGKRQTTPENLMRARFAAYAQGKVRFIIETTHPDSPHWQADQVAWRKSVLQFSRQTHFVGLEIRNAGISPTQPNSATVTFHATLIQAGQDASFTEKSLFQRQNNQWLYVKAL